MDRLQTMKAFVRVVDEGGFAAAARSLDVDQAMITRQLADLERHLGVKLLERTTRSMRLTEAGRDYLARCRDILADISDAEAAISRSQRDMTGRVRIALPTMFSKTESALQLAKLHEDFPNITVDMCLFDRAVDPVAEGFDVVITDAAHGVSALAVARPLLTMPFVLCAAPSYLEAHGAPDTPDDLGRHQCVGQLAAHEAGHAHDRWTLQHADGVQKSVQVRVALRTNAYDISLEAVRAGLALGRLTPHLVAEDFAAKRLMRVLPHWHAGVQSYNLVYPGRRMMTRRVRHVIDTILSQRDTAGHSAMEK